MMMKAAEVERPTGDTYGLYSKGTKSVSRRGRTVWTGGGWYSNTHVGSVAEERIVSMRAAWGRKSSAARRAVRGMWSTREEAEAAALLAVARHPEWIGLLEVRRLVL